MNFGYVEATEYTGGSAKFGLNQNATITKVAAEDIQGKDVLKVYFKFEGDEKDRNFAFFEPKPFSEEKEAIERAYKVRQQQITELGHCFMSKEELKALLDQSITSWKKYITIIADGIKKTGLVGKQKVDLFMQYQTKVREGYKSAFLEVPIFGGAYWGKSFVPHVEGDFKEHYDKEKYILEYVTEDGKKHPIRRTESDGTYLFKTAAFNQLTQEVATPNKAVEIPEDEAPEGGDDEEMPF